MRKLVLIAAMLMASASAHAGNFSFNVEGQKVQVNIPRGCSSLSCINITAPGLADKFKDKEDTSSTSAPAPVATAPAPAPAAAPAPAPQAVVTAPAPQAPVTTVAPPASNKITVLPAPATENTAAPMASVPPLTAPAVSLPPPPAPVVAAPAPAPAPTQVAAVPAPAAAPAPAAVQTATSPIGLWLSEKKEGKIRIEDCGGNLCGWAIEKDGSKSAKMILINMKPKGDKWVGRVHDPRGGGTYDSNIQLRGSDKLKLTGCLMMFCQGETWTRVE